MALLGTGAVLIWNDITPDGRDDFYAWHNTEHMPERAAVPGFLRGRRYIACDQATKPEFFTLYETATPAVLTSAGYLARLNAPTPWTRRATQGFRNTSRALTTVMSSTGPGAGGWIGTIRLAAAPRLDGRLPTDPMLTGVHVCATDVAASGDRTAESKDRTDIGAAPAAAVLVEACAESAVRSALKTMLNEITEQNAGPVEAGVYKLEFDCR